MSSPFSQLRAYQRYMRWQGYQAMPIEQFNGLDLRPAPDESSAIDMLNVDFDRHGTIRSRDGYAVLGTKASNAFDYIYTYRAQDTNGYALAWNGLSGVQAFRLDNGATAGVASGAVASTDGSGFIRSAVLGTTPAGTSAYVAASDNGLRVFDTSALTWSTVGTGALGASWNYPYRVGFTPFDQRLVVACFDPAGLAYRAIRLRFSDPGALTTFGANNYIDLIPGGRELDGIEAIVSWQNQMFVFKRSAYFIFYSTSTDSTGNPIFNYRTVSGVGGFTAAVGRSGVYFYDGKAVWRTTGAVPERISDAIAPYLDGQTQTYFAPNGSWSANVTRGLERITVGADERVYLQLWSNATFVYDPSTGSWAPWDLSASGTAPRAIAPDVGNIANDADDARNMVFVSADTHIYKKSSASATDAGTAITSRYRSGFLHQAGGAEGRVREAIFQGTGTVTFKASTDWGSLNTGESVTMGTSPAIAEGRARGSSFRGRNFSWQVSGTGAWSLQRLVLMLAGARDQVEQ